MLLAQEIPAFHWRILRESRGEEEAKKNSQEQGTVMRAEREKILNGPTGDKRFEDEGVQYWQTKG